jgi:alpha,alpha-trehalase
MELSKTELLDLKATHEYIVANWPHCRVDPSLIKEEVYRLPKPFTPPTPGGLFHCLFYWDTFYTNRGLIQDGHPDWAKDNVDDLIFELREWGFVPNSNSDPGVIYISQPPYLHFMVNDIAEALPDDAWIEDAYQALKKEYDFWMKERITSNGLNRHYGHKSRTKEQLLSYYHYAAKERLNIPLDLPEEEQVKKGAEYAAAAEAGLDFSPRFGDFGGSINPMDLNANLYGLEMDLSRYAERYEMNRSVYFGLLADYRKALMDCFLLGEDGLYYDYDYVNRKRSNLRCSGQFMPFITGLSHNKKACHDLLMSLLGEGGIFSTVKETGSSLPYQAAYPYSWPYDNYLAFWALTTLGMEEDALEVAKRYLTTLAKNFHETGRLWETYDGRDGSIAKKAEYATQEMMGWTAGSFERMYAYLKARGIC